MDEFENKTLYDKFIINFQDIDKEESVGYILGKNQT
jgi:hypothetical protein